MSQRLVPIAAASVPTPPTGKYWFFLNSSDGDAPSLKDDAGAVTRVAGTLIDGDYGDVTVSGSGTIVSLDAGVVSTTELGGDITTAGKALLDDADAAAQRTTLGLGTLATQSGTFSGTHSGTSSGTNTGDQNLFATISVSGQSDVVADATADTLTLAAGSGVTITTDASTDTITISATGTGGTITATGSPANGNLTKFSGATSITNGDLSGDVTTSGALATTIANDAVTYAKMQNASANTVIARASGSSGDLGEVALSTSQLMGRGSTGNVAAITLGSGLSMSGTTLSSNGIVSTDETTYWTAQCAMLDPAAFVHQFSSSFSVTVPTGKTYYVFNAWNARLGGNGGDFFLRDPSKPMAISEGTNLQGNGTANAFLYYCDPSLVSYADPKAKYYERLARLQVLICNHVYATTTAGSGTLGYGPFPSDFSNGLIVAAQAFDVAWTILTNTSSVNPGKLNLMNEISDTHQWRSAASMMLPFQRSVFSGIGVSPASVSGTGTVIAGNGSVMYYKLPSDW